MSTFPMGVPDGGGRDEGRISFDIRLSARDQWTLLDAIAAIPGVDTINMVESTER